MARARPAATARSKREREGVLRGKPEEEAGETERVRKRAALPGGMRAQPALRSIGLAPPRPSPCLLKRAIQLQPDDSECGFVIESDSEPDEPTPQLQAAGRRGFTRLRRASDHNQRPSTREDPLHPRSARGAAAGLESDSDNVDPFPLPSARRSSLHKSVEFISEPLPEALSPARLSSGAPIDAVPWACAEHKGGSREAQTSACLLYTSPSPRD